jgi:hypothetical protein
MQSIQATSYPIHFNEKDTKHKPSFKENTQPIYYCDSNTNAFASPILSSISETDLTLKL